MYDIRNEGTSVGPVPVQTFIRDIGEVKSLQRRLRKVASYNDKALPVVADGVFGEVTEAAVLKFQELYGLEKTGIVNGDTWRRIVEISDGIDSMTRPAGEVLVFNESNAFIYPGERDAQLYVIQAMMKALSETAGNIASPDITGIHDSKSTEAVKSIQLLSGLEDNGIIDAAFINHLGNIYEVFITGERVKNSR